MLARTCITAAKYLLIDGLLRFERRSTTADVQVAARNTRHSIDVE